MIQYIKNIWEGISSSLIGMKITIMHIFVKNVTIQYPDKRFNLPENARNRLFMEMSKCTGCTSCARACPVNCIFIETVRVLPDDPHQEMLDTGIKRKLWLTKFDIDFAKCCYCGLCTAACPTDAIIHTKEYEYSVYDVKELLYHFHTLTPEQISEKKQMLADFQSKEKVCHPDEKTDAVKPAETKAKEDKPTEDKTE